MRPKAYIATPLPQRFLAQIGERCDMVCYQGQGLLPRQELLDGIGDADGLLCPSVLPIDGEVIDKAQRLRVISNIGVGFDNVDLKRATERGIVVTNTPGVLTDAVADLTMALMLALARRLPEATQSVRQGRWDPSGASVPLGTDVEGKTLAIIGLGRIGTAVARRALAFGMRVVYHDIRRDAPDIPGIIARRDLAEALREADFVSLHVNLTKETIHLIGGRELALMKPSAFLINTSRGRVLDQGALETALRHGRLAGAALDVTDPEPLNPAHPLLRLPNVIITPHIGSATRETRAAMVELAVQNLLSSLGGGTPEYVVNPEVLNGPG